MGHADLITAEDAHDVLGMPQGDWNVDIPVRGWKDLHLATAVAVRVNDDARIWTCGGLGLKDACFAALFKYALMSRIVGARCQIRLDVQITRANLESWIRGTDKPWVLRSTVDLGSDQ